MTTKDEIINFTNYERLNIIASNIKYHNIKIDYLKKTYEITPRDEIKDEIKLNESLKNYYSKKMVVLYSRYFINQTKKE